MVIESFITNDLLTSDLVCPGGEIGRRTAFRWQRSQGCAGSNPVPGTYVLIIISVIFYLTNVIVPLLIIFLPFEDSISKKYTYVSAG